MNISAAMGTKPGKRAGNLKAAFASVNLTNTAGLLTRMVRWCAARQRARVASRLLHVEETVSLGQKRFAAVIRVQDARYLVGGGANEVVLLAALGQTAALADETKDASAATSAAVAPKLPTFHDVLEKANASETSVLADDSALSARMV